MAAVAAAPASASPDNTTVSVIVRESAGAADEAEGYVIAHDVVVVGGTR